MNKPLLLLGWCLLLAVSLPAQTSTFTWTGNGNDNQWDNPANWDCTGEACTDRWPGDNGASNDDFVVIKDKNAEIDLPPNMPDMVIAQLDLEQGTLNISLDSRLDIKGDLNTKNNGLINFPDNMSGSGILAVGGDLDLKGDFNAGEGTVIINGSTPQSLKSTGSGRVRFFNLEIDTDGGLSIDRQIEVGGTMTFVQGIVTTDGLNKDVFFLPGAQAAGASNASYIDGWMQKDGQEDFVFPCGDEGFYAPLLITGLTRLNVIDARYIHSDPGANGRDRTRLEAPIQKISEVEYWSVRSADLISFEIGLSLGAHNGTVVAPEDLLVTVWDKPETENGNGGQQLWRNFGGSLTSLAGSTFVISEQPLANPRQFQLVLTMATTNLANALPVELLYFEAKPQSGQVRLRWATASEVGHAAFVVERSRYGKEFEYVAKVEGDGRDRYQQKNYQLTDEQPLPGLSYYRLKQIDMDGTVTYSDIVSVHLSAGAKDGDVALFPNPARHRVTLRSAVPLDDAELELYNVAGQRLSLRYSAAGPQVELPLPALAPGVYFLRITRPGQSVLTKRLVVE